MAKKRLNQTHRDLLINLASQKVRLNFKAQYDALDKKVNAIAGKLADLIESCYNAKDMAVLRRYEKTETYHTGKQFGIQVPNDHNVLRTIEFVLPRAIETVNGDGYWRFTGSVNKKLKWADVSAHHTALEKLQVERAKIDKAREEVFAKYVTLIKSSNNYEDVLAVWSEAAEVSDKIVGVQVGTSLVALSQDTVKFIKKDVEQRAKLAPAATAKKAG